MYKLKIKAIHFQGFMFMVENRLLLHRAVESVVCGMTLLYENKRQTPLI